MSARKFTPWTLLRRRLAPITDELHRATPWRVEPPLTVETWLRHLTWAELQLADITVEPLCHDPPLLNAGLRPLTVATEGSVDESFQERMAQQVMHRLIFASDLPSRMPAVYRRDHRLIGEYSHDAREVLIHAWRTSSALYWARHFGPRYCEDAA